MRTIRIQKADITSLRTDAIVNAANCGLTAGGGVCGAIFKAAGYNRMRNACEKLGGCETGSAVVTPGFDLPAKIVIHAVGPKWTDGKHGEPELLYGAYFKALELAAENGCGSIGFPLISAGSFGFPPENAWDRALRACADFLDQHPKAPFDIVFAIPDDGLLELGEKTLRHSGASRYKIAERGDWKTLPMPEKNASFILERHFLPQQMEILRGGHIPHEMEDKWFFFMEGATLYAHRSWTGFCIYRVCFQPDDHHVVTFNQDPEQTAHMDTAEAAKTLNDLLDSWAQATYDYYRQWLTETAAAIKKARRIQDKLRISGAEIDAVYFHLPTEPNGYLSNWYISPFELDGWRFTSVEQYIMFRKCLAFGDAAAAAAVLKTDDPAQQQKLGRSAAGYIDAVWAGLRQTVVLRGLLAKFSQNDDLKQKLLATGDAALVECAGSDRIWACGVPLNDDRRRDAASWTGMNLLGFALMEARETLKRNAPGAQT